MSVSELGLCHSLSHLVWDQKDVGGQPFRRHPGRHTAASLERRGRLEAAIDLLRPARLEPAAAGCEVLNDQGDLAGGRELSAFASEMQLPVGDQRGRRVTL